MERVDLGGFELTLHARRRMSQRNIPQAAIAAALEYGRIERVRGAVIHAIGRREIRHFAGRNPDLRRFDGVQVVCAPDGSVMTVYRNPDFRSLRDNRHKNRNPQRPGG